LSLPPKATLHAHPSLNRVDFYRLEGTDFLALLAEAVRKAGEEKARGTLSADHVALAAFASMLVNVPNGGFTQFFYNHNGDSGVEQAAELLGRLGAAKAGTVLRDARAVYCRHRAEFAVSNPFDGLFRRIAEFDKVDRAFYRVMGQGTRAMASWARQHAASLFAGDDGRGPIDPGHTGLVEARHPNGALSQSLEVRRGKPHGAYRKFFDDGKPSDAALFRNGKAAGELWLNDQLRKKESRSGAHRIVEWYYKSGALQKRFVGDKSLNAVEPVRLFHENGQLAEEAHLQGPVPLGPWLKFFQDGSSKLVAEWRPGSELVVRQAWGDDRRQMVCNGTGTFHDDGRRITPFYDLFFESLWPRTIELRDGRPHGKETTWHAGSVWTVRHFENGVLHGESTMYYDNGRLRSVTEYVHGVEGATRRFPKFDAPRPAVLLGAMADEQLYAAWKHRRLDEYPCPLNLPEVQALIAVPEMLSEVHARNLAGALKSDYEDLNTFNDGIAYRVRIDEAGRVVSARATGGGVYSIGLAGTHVPLLRKLRFSPGQLRAQAVACEVCVTVDHTFVEGATP
jgi:antitoxin component YwqK of YwqJK toxin-antitoxin module